MLRFIFENHFKNMRFKRFVLNFSLLFSKIFQIRCLKLYQLIEQSSKSHLEKMINGPMIYGHLIDQLLEKELETLNYFKKYNLNLILIQRRLVR